MKMESIIETLSISKYEITLTIFDAVGIGTIHETRFKTRRRLRDKVHFAALAPITDALGEII